MEKKLQTVKDILNMRITPMEPFDNLYHYTIETLFDWYISKIDGKDRIQRFLEDWDEEAQKYWLEKLSERIIEEECAFDGFDGFDEYVIDVGPENEDGVIWGDVFWLLYHNINVFFAVSFTDKKKVAIYELAKKKVHIDGKTFEQIICKFQPTKSPYYVLKNNCASKTDCWVSTENKDIQMEDNILRNVKTLKIDIRPYSKLFLKALDNGIKYPKTGEFLAVHIPEPETSVFEYWKPEKKKKKQKDSLPN